MKTKLPWCNDPSLFSYSDSLIQINEFDHILKTIQEICSYHGKDYQDGRDIHITRLDAKFIKMLASSSPSKVYIDIGTNMGLSACIMASIPGSRVLTLEKNPDHALLARDLFKRFPNYNIELIEGDAHDSLSKIKEKCGFVFIDAEKKGYLEYFNWANQHLVNQGWVVADNVFALGSIALDDQVIPKKIKGIVNSLRHFNQTLLTHPNYESLILPTQEGLLAACKIR